jgi:hypothetical protein
MSDLDLQKIMADAEAGAGDMNRIDPKVMTAIMAMAQAGQLVKIRKNLEDRTSDGWTRGMTFTVTDVIRPPGGYTIDPAAQSINLHNDGPALIYIGFNNFVNPSALDVDETLTVDFGAHKLNLIYTWCPPTLTSVVRATIKG